MTNTETAAQLDLDRLGAAIRAAKEDNIYNWAGYIGMTADDAISLIAQARAQPAAEAEILALHRQLAGEKLRADQGWERAEAKSRECIELRERFAAPIAPSVNSGEGAPSVKTWQERMWPGYVDEGYDLPEEVAMKAEIADLRAQFVQQRQAAPHAPADWANWIVRNGRGLPDHACIECVPHSDMIVAGFQCVFHQALAYAAAPAAPHAQAEPVAWIDEFGNVFPLGAFTVDGKLNWSNAHKRNWKPLYPAPVPQEAEQASASPAGPRCFGMDCFCNGHCIHTHTTTKV